MKLDEDLEENLMNSMEFIKHSLVHYVNKAPNHWFLRIAGSGESIKEKNRSF